MKKIVLLAMLAWGSMVSYAQTDSLTMEYRRSSLYSLLINHDDQKFAKEISDVFLQIPTPDKYNNHNLSVRVVSMSTKLKDTEVVNDFIEKNQIASRLVSRWFNRDPFTGVCDVELVKKRGLYDANEFDRELAARSKRGVAMLEDAGEELIGNTFGSSDISSDSFLKRKTAEQIVYLNCDQQMHSYEQQFSISCLGSLYPQMHS